MRSIPKGLAAIFAIMGGSLGLAIAAQFFSFPFSLPFPSYVGESAIQRTPTWMSPSRWMGALAMCAVVRAAVGAWQAIVLPRLGGMTLVGAAAALFVAHVALHA